MCVLITISPNITQDILCPTFPPFNGKQCMSLRHFKDHYDSVEAAAMLLSLFSETYVDGVIVNKPYTLRFDVELTNGELSTPFPQKDGFLSSRSLTMPTNSKKKRNSTLSFSAKQFYLLSNSRKQMRINVKENIHSKAWRMKQ